MMPEGNLRDPELGRRLSQVLAVGVWAAVALLSLGILMLLVRGPGVTEGTDLLAYPQPLFREDPIAVLRRASRLEALALVEVGLLVLIATPAVRVLASGFLFLKRREWILVGISAVVLIVITLAWWG